jgi:putative membrane protein
MCFEGFHWFGFGGLWMFLIWGAVIAFIVWAVIKLTKRDNFVSKINHIDIAKERYAKGEISKEEFEQIRKDLS